MALVDAHIGGDPDLTSGTFRNPNGDALNAQGLRIACAGFWRPKEVIGGLHLGFARATVWVDDRTGRATPTVLGGFWYDALSPGPDQVGPDERIA